MSSEFERACWRFREQIRTARRRELFDAMLTALGNGWVQVRAHGLLVRWDRVLPMPDYIKTDHLGKPTVWANSPTYKQLVFLQLVTPDSNPLLKVWRAEWVNRQDTEITLTRAFEVLADPACALDRKEP